MTPGGHRKIREELDRLMKVERPKNVRDIAEARAHGDLSENAEYHAAKERQSFLEGRIVDLQGKIARAHVIDPAKLNHDKVAFGATVSLLDVETEEECCYSLVGSEEADVKSGKISIDSPVGKSLLGREVGDEVVIRAPAKVMRYEIIDIAYKEL
jgi:transcription elongation factor GreA